MPYGFYYGSLDWTFLMLIVLMLIASIASAKVKSTFNKYHQVRSSRGLTGAQAAEQMLKNNGLYDVKVERVSGFLSDHYDPRTKTIRLSEPVYNNPSVASISVACHEAGHALQHAQEYGPLKARTALLPLATLGTQAVWPLFFAGIFFQLTNLITIGIIFFAFSVLFQVVTLPVEFDASARALKMMDEYGMLSGEENVGAKKVLNAAAMTYVAAAAIAVGQLVRMIAMSKRRR